SERRSPITAAALLGSFFSLLRRMNTPGHPALDAGSSAGPLVGIAFAGIPCPGISGFRIKCGMTGSTASQRGMTWSTASNAE
ncbi:hypothetical protein, partial [Barnesiella sp. An22]|uniref:hypothetical protein n=1 Tax=Barnesiella sp. An22 TaxID=1965590 RepID=UPI0019D303D9